MANKLELSWFGKDEPMHIEPRLLIENTELSNTTEDPDTENILIHGDNLLALKALEPMYAGQIKCIYIVRLSIPDRHLNIMMIILSIQFGLISCMRGLNFCIGCLRQTECFGFIWMMLRCTTARWCLMKYFQDTILFPIVPMKDQRLPV